MGISKKISSFLKKDVNEITILRLDSFLKTRRSIMEILNEIFSWCLGFVKAHPVLTLFIVYVLLISGGMLFLRVMELIFDNGARESGCNNCGGTGWVSRDGYLNEPCPHCEDSLWESDLEQ